MFARYHPLKRVEDPPESFLSAIETFSRLQFYSELQSLLSGKSSDYFYSSVTERYTKISLVPTYSSTFSIKSTYNDVFNFNEHDINMINHVLETAAIYHSIADRCVSTENNLKDSLAEVFSQSIVECVLGNYLNTLPKDPIPEELFQFSLLWRNRLVYFNQVHLGLHSEIGLNILNSLYKEYTSKVSQTWESESLKTILYNLYKRFMVQLKEWLLYGKLPYHNKDWIFYKRQEIPDCRKWKEWISPRTKLFPISMKYIISIFDDFLSIGKAQLFLQEANYRSKFKENVQKMSKLFDELKEPSVFYEIKSRYNLCYIAGQMKRIANDYIIERIFDDEHLIDHWRIIKAYFLLTDTDISKKILSEVENSVEITMDQINFNFSKIIDSCDLIRMSHIQSSFTTFYYTNPHASQRNSTAFIIPNLNFATMEPIGTDFSSSLTISIVMNEKTFKSLQRIFKLTLSLFAVYSGFEEVIPLIREGFLSVPKSINPSKENYPLYRLMIHFKRTFHWINLFLNKCHHYVFTYIIPKHTKEFEDTLISLGSIDLIINEMKLFLKKLRHDLFMDEKSKNVFITLLETLCFCNDYLYFLKSSLYKIITPDVQLSPVEVVSMEREISSFLTIFINKLDHIGDCIIKECPQSSMNIERKNFYNMILQLLNNAFGSLIFFRATLYSLRWFFFRKHFFKKIITETKLSSKKINEKNKDDNKLTSYFCNVPPEKRWRITNEIVSLIHSIISAFWTIFVLIEGYNILNDYERGFTYNGAILCMMSLGYFKSDMIDTLVNERGFKMFELVTHHILSIIGVLLPFTIGKYMQLVMMGLIMEMNSIFLHIRLLMMYKNFDKKKKSFKIVSILSVITFVIFRIFPNIYLVILYIYFFASGKKETIIVAILIFFIVFGLLASNIVMFIRLIKTDYLNKKKKNSQRNNIKKKKNISNTSSTSTSTKIKNSEYTNV
uniref:TLC domain-containing protein n=1 Tax=Strongyloides stercoralis TaxID=6248 RepID=A0AAF5DAR9_STRER